MRTILLSFSFLLLVAACQNKGAADSAPAQDKFDAAYPEMYSSLGLPEYRKGNIQDISGKTEGVKTEHTIIIMAPDSPRVLNAYYTDALTNLGWRDLKARRRISQNISDDDLYMASYIKGVNRLDINGSSTKTGETKLRVTLAVFQEN